MDERGELNLETYLHEMRTLLRRSEAPGARVLRRQRLLPALRHHVEAEHRRRRRSHFWKGLAIGALTFGTAAGLVAVAVRPSVRPVTPLSTVANTEIGVAVTPGTILLNKSTGPPALAAAQAV